MMCVFFPYLSKQLCLPTTIIHQNILKMCRNLAIRSVLILLFALQLQRCNKPFDSTPPLTLPGDSTVQPPADTTVNPHDTATTPPVTDTTPLPPVTDTTMCRSSDSTFTDPRDNKKYTFRRIGTQTWMTENLAYDTASSTVYDYSLANEVKYGRLYNWYTALNVAPPGWHLPSREEWLTLISYLGGVPNAGGAMKATCGWKLPNTGATNSSGFFALPGGMQDSRSYFHYEGEQGNWWTSTDQEYAYARQFAIGAGDAAVFDEMLKKTHAISIRCIKNE